MNLAGGSLLCLFPTQVPILHNGDLLGLLIDYSNFFASDEWLCQWNVSLLEIYYQEEIQKRRYTNMFPQNSMKSRLTPIKPWATTAIWIMGLGMIRLAQNLPPLVRIHVLNVFYVLGIRGMDPIDVIAALQVLKVQCGRGKRPETVNQRVMMVSVRRGDSGIPQQDDNYKLGAFRDRNQSKAWSLSMSYQGKRQCFFPFKWCQGKDRYHITPRLVTRGS